VCVELGAPLPMGQYLVRVSLCIPSSDTRSIGAPAPPSLRYIGDFIVDDSWSLSTLKTTIAALPVTVAG
jgi:hypothetical protein